MKHLSSKRLALSAGLCAAVGAVAGITGSAAAPTHRSPRVPSIGRPGALPDRPGLGMHGPAVHADEVVLNRTGRAFITATRDNGTVASISGNQLTIKEGFGSVTYKTVTLSIPSGVTVYRNFAAAKLADLKAGDRVHVSQSSEGTTVLADDGTMPRFPGHRFRGDRESGPDGPPPGAPGGTTGPSGFQG